MIAIALIALAAGSASALMFISPVSGAGITLLLINLAPLPLMVAALGWGPLAATVGGIAAASVLGLIFGLPMCVAFASMVALPAWWLAHLALLGRPIPNGGAGNGATAPAMEWYPVGRVLLWLAGFAILTTMGTLLTLGTDAETITGVLRRVLLRFLKPRIADADSWIDALVIIAPAVAAIGPMLMLMFNLWLAAKITATSGRLHRPWPDLKTTSLPPMTLVALSVAIAFCFVGGLLAMLAHISVVTLIMAYALTGFAVLHTLTLAMKGRSLWLSCTYAFLLLLPWAIIAVAVLGLADAFFGLRQRFLRGRPPPLPAA